MTQQHAALDREPPGLQRRAILGQLFHVLRIHIVTLEPIAETPSAQQVGAGARREAHEVALHRAFIKRVGQFVIGQGEMVHADVAVTGAREAVVCLQENA